MQSNFLSPAEVAELVVGVGQRKAEMSVTNQLILGVMAGAFIAFGAAGSCVAVHTVESAGVAKALAGALFAAGLIMVVVAGGELFTGNSLMLMALAEGRISPWQLLRSWLVVYAGNFAGALLTAGLVCLSGQWGMSGGLLGASVIKTAAGKTALSFQNAFFLGILCNWLVCLAVWMSFAARDIAGKVLVIFFPIWIFVTSGFEHSVANMYYIPAGILAAADPALAERAASVGLSPEALANLNWGAMLQANLLPVTLGNVVGGGVLVALACWFVYRRDKR
ncbi:formate/nitrite transporter family protein [Fretibacterium fastidiosum]|uniref:Formate/nitrite family of transporters n=1 Tax=Fretibacterium fastidiosum TaxID=651822 RepID=A0AB94IWU1_9BACT|nr:formate/nitrite transporter family protein [Fretibacterium fastidiosum]CBL28199.1 Formate/nitrite family of transporters [Fretibacterium fastidiosum]